MSTALNLSSFICHNCFTNFSVERDHARIGDCRSSRAPLNIRAAFREMSSGTFWLFCWSIGGLILMSIIPRKSRRIFSSHSTLCLLVATQAARFLNGEKQRARNFRWATAILALAVLFSGGYAASRVVSGYRDHRDALSIFGRKYAKKRPGIIGDTKRSDRPMKDCHLLNAAAFFETRSSDREWNGGEINASRSLQTRRSILCASYTTPLADSNQVPRKIFGGRNVLLTR